MTSFADIWGSLQQAGKPTPYVLIDCAGIDGGEPRIPHDAFSELECLFTGDLAIELANVGPYLGRLKSYEPEVKAVVEDMLNGQVALLVMLQEVTDEQAEITFSQLHRHFRKFNVVYDPSGKPLFFRYYDSRLMVDVLNMLEPDQRNAFFGPIASFVLAREPAKLVRCFRRGGEVAVAD